MAVDRDGDLITGPGVAGHRPGDRHLPRPFGRVYGVVRGDVRIQGNDGVGRGQVHRVSLVVGDGGAVRAGDRGLDHLVGIRGQVAAAHLGREGAVRADRGGVIMAVDRDRDQVAGMGPAADHAGHPDRALGLGDVDGVVRGDVRVQGDPGIRHGAGLVAGLVNRGPGSGVGHHRVQGRGVDDRTAGLARVGLEQRAAGHVMGPVFRQRDIRGMILRRRFGTMLFLRPRFRRLGPLRLHVLAQHAQVGGVGEVGGAHHLEEVGQASRHPGGVPSARGEHHLRRRTADGVEGAVGNQHLAAVGKGEQQVYVGNVHRYQRGRILRQDYGSVGVDPGVFHHAVVRALAPCAAVRPFSHFSPSLLLWSPGTSGDPHEP